MLACIAVAASASSFSSGGIRSGHEKYIKKTKAFIKDDSNKNLVSINVLEFVTIIINFAAALTALTIDGHDDDPFPVLLNFADNMSSVRWTNHYCKGSLKALTR